jgi:hypothetical protein
MNRKFVEVYIKTVLDKVENEVYLLPKMYTLLKMI